MGNIALFIDDGGVLNDNSLRGPQWQRYVGEYFSPLLGGSIEEWARANRTVVLSMIERSAWRARLEAAAGYEDFEHTYYIDWLGSMCDDVGVSRPSDAEAIELARSATMSILPRVRAAIPGAAETIRLLHGLGYALYTASGGSSTELAAHLRPMGIVDCFVRLYGPDLAGAFKSGPEFYRRILADSGLSAERAIVVEDNPEAVGWARSVGIRCVHVGPPAASAEDPYVSTIETINELPALLEAITQPGMIEAS